MTKALRYPHARRYLARQFWAIREETLDVIRNILQMRAEGIALTAEEIRAQLGAARVSNGGFSGLIAVLPIYGVIDQKIGGMGDISGGTAVDRFMKDFRGALGDPAVGAILLDVDSPGGNIAGVPEAAAEILAARGTKPMAAIANTEIASAAYYLACAVDVGQLVSMPSGFVGSIGVLAVHDDFSAANEMDGYKPTYIFSGQYKTEFNSDEPLTDDARAYVQMQVDAAGEEFYKFVAKARGVSTDVVRATYGQGRMLRAKDALAAKMIDRIDTFPGTLARLAKDVKSASGARVGAIAAAVTPELGAASHEATVSESGDIEFAEPATADTVCATCHGSGLQPERFMSDPQGQETCPACGGTGKAAPPASDQVGVQAPRDQEAVAQLARQHQADLDRIDLALAGRRS